MCLPVWGSHAFAQKAESYAVFDEYNATLTFKHDTNRPFRAFSLNEGEEGPGWCNLNDIEWNTNIIWKVIFDASFAKARPTSCSKWFYGCDELTFIEGIEYLNTENVTNMSKMFRNCRNLKTLDLSSFDTKNVTDMSDMFNRCEALTTLDLSSFNTKNVTDMRAMFEDCSTLKTLDLSSFNTKRVEYMNAMFEGCSALTTLNLSNFDTKNVWSMSEMFSGCSALTTLNLSNFNTKHVTDMNHMFGHCSALKTLDLSSFNTKSVADMDYMFSNCSALTTIYTSYNFVTPTWNDANCMFTGCANLVGAVPYDANKVGSEMANYTTGYFTYKAPKIKGPYAVFDKSTNTLTFKHDNNTPTGMAFELNEGTETPDWYKYHDDISKVIFDASFANARPTSCYSWFYGCKYLTTIEGIEYLNTKNVTDMRWMFQSCSALTTLDLSKFDTQNVTDMECMFNGCKALTTLDLSNFDTRNVKSMSWMFNGCPALTTIYASEKYVTTACDYDYDMFAGCTNLVGAVPYDENNVDGDMANYTTGYFTYKASTGIDAPTVSDNTAAEYYDLQGRRLNAPQKGVNIVKCGKKTTKMLVK